MQDPAVIDDNSIPPTRFAWSRWQQLAAAAGIGFLWLLAAGAVLLVAAKLDFPALGAESDPVEVLTAVVIFGLACLRAPVHAGALTLSVIPLAALALVGWGFSDAVGRVVGRVPAGGVTSRALAGAAAAIPFAALCCATALIFRFRGETTAVGVDAIGASIAGLVWGAIFGAVGGLISHASLKT
ncbi:MAG: hypothetical protein M3290_06790, partial [Actinomycetota bacterium]|nr:hypothetical protein [Actinomycetota bacterium]